MTSNQNPAIDTNAAVKLENASEAQTEIVVPATPVSTESRGLFKVSRSVFQRQLGIAGRLITSKANMPILKCVALAFGDGKLAVESSDLSNYVTTEVPAETTGGFRLAVPHAVLSKFVSRCSSEFIMAEVRGNKLFISDIENRTNIVGMSAEEFPPCSAASPIPFLDIGGAQLARAITDTLFCASEDEARFVLMSVAISLGKESVVVATDGRRLAKTALVATEVHVEPRVVIIPENIAEIIRSTVSKDAPVAITTTSDFRRFTMQANETGFAYALHARFIEANYPNYAQVIPKGKHGTEFTFDRAELLAAFGRVMVLNTAKAESVKLTIAKDTLTVSAMSPELGDGKEAVTVQGGTKNAIEIGVNPNFIVDALLHWEDAKLTMQIKDEVSPILLGGDGKVSVIMPVRLS